jgi:hypothetical protein
MRNRPFRRTDTILRNGTLSKTGILSTNRTPSGKQTRSQKTETLSESGDSSLEEHPAKTNCKHLTLSFLQSLFQRRFLSLFIVWVSLTKASAGICASYKHGVLHLYDCEQTERNGLKGGGLDGSKALYPSVCRPWKGLDVSFTRETKKRKEMKKFIK